MRIAQLGLVDERVILNDVYMVAWQNWAFQACGVERKLESQHRNKQAEAKEKNEPAIFEDWEYNYADHVYAELRKDYVQAYMWFKLVDVEANPNLSFAKAHMTPEQIVKGEQLAAEWRSRHPVP
jgi:hypothetical protein